MTAQHSKRHFTAVLCALSIALLAGCATAPPQESIGPNDPAAINGLRQTFIKMNEQKSWRVRMTSVSDGKTITQSVTFVQPDRIHMVSDEMEQIHIAGAAYMKTGTSGWQRIPFGFGSLIEQFRKDPALIESSFRGTTIVGKETLDGRAMTVYRYYASIKLAGGLVSGGGWNKMWVDGGGLPRRAESEGQGQFLGFSGKPSKTTLIYSDYGAAIRIVAPI